MQFDPSVYLDLEIAEPSVKRPPLPIQDYTSVIKDVLVREWTSKEKVDEATGMLKSGIAFDIIHTVNVPADIKERLGYDKDTIELKDSIMPQFTPEGHLDNGPGKNRQIRTYREATDMNKPGDTFSPKRLLGKNVRVKIGHRMVNGEPYEEIQGVAQA